MTRAERAERQQASDLVSVEAAVAAGGAAITSLQTSQAAQDTTIAAKLDDAPNDANYYGRKGAAWARLSVAALPPT